MECSCYQLVVQLCDSVPSISATISGFFEVMNSECAFYGNHMEFFHGYMPGNPIP